MTPNAAVAAGNADTAAAAVRVLRSGGNAFDAAIAAGFAAAVSEPCLSSLGGGGFVLAAPVGAAPVVFDFFVDAPGRGRPPDRLEPSFLPVTVRFGGADQVFHAGWGAAAVPGCLDGYLHVHRRLGRLPLADVVEPARLLARHGTVLDGTQAELLALLEQILTLTPEGRQIFAPRGTLLRTGARMRNEALADTLADVAAGRLAGFGAPRLGGPLEETMTRFGGLVTALDLAAYRVVEREPLSVVYRGARVVTNPPPSFGGSIIAGALAELEQVATVEERGADRPAPAPAVAGHDHDAVAAYLRLAEALVGLSERHVGAPASVRGTTHVSVVDHEGNVASMTTSNGSCSGAFVPGTGIQLNNVMGEADLHPDGFHATPAGVRIGSMMAPTVLSAADGAVVGVGSGGSERIRSALTCVITGLVDRPRLSDGRLPLAAVLGAPRLHWDRAVLQVEPGLPDAVLDAFRRRWPVNVWRRRDLYFGGAHAVSRTRDGRVGAAGDDRRGGVGRLVTLPVDTPAHPAT